MIYKVCLELYKSAIRGLRKHLLNQLWMGDDLGYVLVVMSGIGENIVNSTKIQQVMELQHLACFVPGMLVLGEPTHNNHNHYVCLKLSFCGD